MRKVLLFAMVIGTFGSLSAITALKREATDKKISFPPKKALEVSMVKTKMTDAMRSVALVENDNEHTSVVPEKVKQGATAAVALFNRPSGTYIPSLIGNEDPQYLGYYYSYPGFFGSGFSQKWVFPNLSTGATSYSWDWGTSLDYSKSTNLELFTYYKEGTSANFLEAGSYYAPVLNAINGLDTVSYELKGGSNYPVIYASTASKYISNADFYCNTAYSTSGNSMYIITASGSTGLNGSGTGYYWGSAQRTTDATNNNKPTKVSSVVTFFAKPMSPMSIKDLCLFGVNRDNTTPLANGVTLKVSLIKVALDGTLTTDTIASSGITASDLVIEQATSSKYVYLPVKFKQVDPETGREGDLTVVVKDRFAVVLSGLEQTGVDFGLYCDYQNQIEKTSYFTKVDAATGTPLSGFYSSTTKMNAYVMLNAYFNYLYVDPTTSSLTAPVDGGAAVNTSNEAGAVVYSMFNVVDTLGNTLVWIDDTTLPEWLTLTYDDSYFADYGALVFNLKASALPTGTTTRSASVKLLSYGAEATISVTQSSANGLVITKSSNIKVTTDDNSFNLTYPAGFNSVEVYNIAGQQLGKYALSSAGSATIPADKAHGSYLLRFSGATTETIKILK